MTLDEKERVVMQLVATAEVMGHELKLSTVMIMADDLAEYDFNAVMIALTRCRKELTGKLTLKAILDILAPSDGWLSANEAWAQALLAEDEAVTMVWTAETRKAWFIALPLIEARDKIGARMAFIAAYDREVSQAKAAGLRPQIEVSRGEREDMYLQAVAKAQTAGLLPAPPKQELLPPSPEEEAVMADNRERIRQSLRELAESLAVSGKQREKEQEEARLERKRQANRHFEEQRAATMAAIEAHEGKGDEE